MPSNMLGAAVLAGAMVAVAAPAAAAQMDGGEIRSAVAGKRVFLQVPLGGEFPLYYRANGRVDGTGEAVGLGKYMQPKDSGRWWVDGDRLCQQWQAWYDGRVFCFTLTRAGEGQLAWRRDDGRTGTARIGR